MSTKRNCTPKTVWDHHKLAASAHEGENKVRGREGRATEWAQSEMLLEVRDGFASVVSIQQLLASMLNLAACI